MAICLSNKSLEIIAQHVLNNVYKSQEVVEYHCTGGMLTLKEERRLVKR